MLNSNELFEYYLEKKGFYDSNTTFEKSRNFAKK